MRVCLVYDCLYPYTVGGAERWYRNLAERLVADGHQVTYLTRRPTEGEAQAPGGRLPGATPRGVRVLAVPPRMERYARVRRRLLPPLAFGLGVWRHLRSHGRSYDVV